MNPYLKRLRDQYDALRSSIDGLQNRATEEKRDLTADELRSVTEQGEQAKGLLTQITTLTEIETRNAKVAELAASLAGDGAGDPDGQQQAPPGLGDTGTSARHAAGGRDFPTRGTRRLGGATTQERDPGIYLRSGNNSFFRDVYRASTGDYEARQRLELHSRALDTGGAGTGVVPPRWLLDEYEAIARQGRQLADAVRNIPLGDDPRPITMPKQTSGTSTAVADQVAENDPLVDVDEWESDVDTVTPKPTAGKQTVSRQLLDMASPAIDQLIYGDLIAEYNRRVEAKVGTAIRAVGTALTATQTQFHDMSTPLTNGSDLAVRAAVAVRKARKAAADLLVMTVDRWGEYLQLKDTTGRPLMPAESAGPVNVIGVGQVNSDGRLSSAGLSAVASDGMDDGVVGTDTFAAIRAMDTILFESNMYRFRFEEQKGPESIVLGIWAYTAVIVRRGTESVKRVVIDLTA